MGCTSSSDVTSAKKADVSGIKFEDTNVEVVDNFFKSAKSVLDKFTSISHKIYTTS